MSVYDQPYEVITHNLSAYVGTPEEVLRIARRTTGEVRINLGYGEVGWQDEHGTEITRRTLRRVLLSEIEYRVAKKEVASMIERLRAPHDAGGEFVIQRRYQPGSGMAKSFGEGWHDLAASNPGVTRERAEMELARTRERFPGDEFRLRP